VQRFVRTQLWARAVGLIAAYAFVLQTFLVSVVATQVVAADPFGDADFVICSSDSHSTDAPRDEGANHLVKCGLLCALAHSTITPVPDAIPMAAWAGIVTTSLLQDRTRSSAVASPRAVRSGLSRAPPRTA
jgi:DUF2946 family protein